MKRPPFDRRIPLFIVLAGAFAVLVALAGFNLSLRKMSEHHPPAGDQTTLERRGPVEERTAAGLGWSLELGVEDHLFTARLMDSTSKPVTGAQGRLVLNGDAAGRLDIPLQETTPGRYVASLPQDARRQIEARVELEKESGRIARSFLIAF